MRKHAETSFYTPDSPEAAAAWYTKQKELKRMVFWDGVDKRLVSTSESDLRKLGVKDLSKLARIYSEANIIAQMESHWDPTPSAMGSVGRVITYKGQLYTLHKITAATPVWYKTRLMKALRKVGKRFIKGVTFKIVKGSGRSFTSPNSHIVNISEDDLAHRGVDCEALGKKLPPHVPYTCGHSACPFGLEKLGKVDFGLDHAAHVIAHELGHNFWNHRMSSDLRAKYIPRIAKLPVKTKTVKDYERYVADRIQDQEDDGVSHVSISLQNKIAHEKFAEMYRLFVMAGKYVPLMSAILADIKKAGPRKKVDTTPHSDKAQQLPEESRKERPYLGDN
jgi:hypothetical protein